MTKPRPRWQFPLLFGIFFSLVVITAQGADRTIIVLGLVWGTFSPQSKGFGASNDQQAETVTQKRATAAQERVW